MSNGNYVIYSPYWHGVGAVTWSSGTSGVKGIVSATNSLVGNTVGDLVESSITPLSDGDYLVRASNWDNGSATDAGAIIWGSGTSGVIGVISTDNSLVGSTSGDIIGYLYGDDEHFSLLPNGGYVISSPVWDKGETVDAGAVTWGDGIEGTSDPIIAENSVRGKAPGGGLSVNYKYDPIHNQVIIGWPSDNIVSILRPNILLFLPITIR